MKKFFLGNLLAFLTVCTLITSCTKEDEKPSPATIGFITVSSSSNESEGSKSANIALSRAASKDVLIAYSISGTATKGSDFTSATISTILIPAGEMTGSIDYTIIDDKEYEANAETIIFTLESATEGVIVDSEKGTFTQTIVEEIPGTVSLSTTTGSGHEASGVVNLTAKLSKAGPNDVVVNYELAGVATFGKDYTLPTSIIIPAGQTSASVQLEIIDDQMIEIRDEDIILTLTEANNGATISSNLNEKVFTYTIADNDVASAPNASAMIIDVTWNTGVDDTDIDMELMLEGSALIAGSSESGSTFESYTFWNDRTDGNYYLTIIHYGGDEDVEFSVVTTHSDGTRQVFFGTFAPGSTGDQNEFIKIVKAGSSFTVSK